MLKAELSESTYKSLPIEVRKEITIVSVENSEYKEDDEWSKLKEASNMAYKALKKREFAIREHLSK